MNYNDDTMLDSNNSVKNNNGSNGSGAAIGALAGVVGGAATAAGGIVLSGSSLVPEQEVTVEPEQVPAVEAEPENAAASAGNTSHGHHLNWSVDGDVPIASGVSDDMSFAQAFAAARAEVGAGGCFEWRGGVYGTYYETEWNHMTPAERAEYESHFSWNQHHDSHTADHHDAQEAQVADVVVPDNHHDVTVVTEADEMDDVYMESTVDAVDENDVQILGFDSDGVSDEAVFVDNDDVIYVDLSADQDNFEMSMPMGAAGDLMDSDIMMEEEMSFDSNTPENLFADGDTNCVDDYYA